MTHFKTLTHQAWVDSQNRNQENHFTEVLKLRELTKQQVVLIAERDQKILQLEKKQRDQERVIRTLSAMLTHSTDVEVHSHDAPPHSLQEIDL